MLVPGVEVHRCRGCSIFRIKGDDQVISGGEGVMERPGADRRGWLSRRAGPCHSPK